MLHQRGVPFHWGVCPALPCPALHCTALTAVSQCKCAAKLGGVSQLLMPCFDQLMHCCFPGGAPLLAGARAGDSSAAAAQASGLQGAGERGARCIVHSPCCPGATALPAAMLPRGLHFVPHPAAPCQHAATDKVLPAHLASMPGNRPILCATFILSVVQLSGRFQRVDTSEDADYVAPSAADGEDDDDAFVAKVGRACLGGVQMDPRHGRLSCVLF